MTRTEKLRKLANAIKDYRGSYHPESKKWIRAPRKLDAWRLEASMERLGKPFTPEVLKQIDGFKSLDEMHEFIATL